MFTTFPRHWTAFLALCLFAPPAGAAADAPVLRVGVTPSFPPLVFKDGGKLVGMEMDFARALGTYLGRKVEFVELAWEDQIPKLTENRIDIVMSSMSITRPRQFRVRFSDPYFRIGQMALIRRDDRHFYALGFPFNPPGTIGVLKNTTGDFLVQQEFSRNKRKTFTNPSTAARALAGKRIDLFVSDSPLIWYLEAQNDTKGLEAVRVFLSDEALGWAVRQSDDALLGRVNGFLKEIMADGRHRQIIKTWLPTAP